jgi:hypothetical protein
MRASLRRRTFRNDRNHPVGVRPGVGGHQGILPGTKSADLSPKPTRPATPPEYRFTDDAKVAIVQARNEALFRDAPAVAPAHLALGVIHTQSRKQLNLLFPDPGNFDLLCRALGGDHDPAPVIPRDIGYLDSSRDALDGATRLAAAAGADGDTHPLHILLGLMHPWNWASNHAVDPDEVALSLAATGLGESRLRALLVMFLDAT